MSLRTLRVPSGQTGGLRLEHWFELERVDGGSVLRHTIDGTAVGKYQQIWSGHIGADTTRSSRLFSDNVAARAAIDG
jgi:hypothetical protein